MAFTSRWVCRITEPMDFDEIDMKLGKYFVSQKSEISDEMLRTMVHLNEEFIGEQGQRYASGRIYFQEEIPFETYEISQERKLTKKSGLRKETRWTDFYYASNPGLMLFGNHSQYSIIGRNKISEILFGSKEAIAGLSFDIEKIERDVLNGTIPGMWTVCFKDRNGNIKSGVAYGDNVDKDPMYGQIIGAPRNFIGVTIRMPARDFRVNIYRSGTITVLANLEDPTDIQDVFAIVEFAGQYASVP